LNILTLAPDSKIDNLAIDKITAYHEAKGDIVSKVDKWMGNIDLIYISIIFKRNAWLVESLRVKYPNIEIMAGGPGLDPTITLPPDIENTHPSRKGNREYSIMRISTGCPRRCYYCMVRVQDPKIRYVMSAKDQYKKGTIMRILNDNILAIPDAMYRWDVLKELVVERFLMVNFDYRTPKLERIARRGVRPAIWRTLETEDIFEAWEPKQNNLFTFNEPEVSA